MVNSQFAPRLPQHINSPWDSDLLAICPPIVSKAHPDKTHWASVNPEGRCSESPYCWRQFFRMCSGQLEKRG